MDYYHPADMLPDVGDPDYEKKILLLRREREELNSVHQALWRLDNGVFGVCESCGDDIAMDRLMAIPYTKFCVACSDRKEHERQLQGNFRSRMDPTAEGSP